MWPFPDYAHPSQLLSWKEKENPWKKIIITCFKTRTWNIFVERLAFVDTFINPEISSTSLGPLTESPDSVICRLFLRIFTDPSYWLEAKRVLLYTLQLFQEVIWTKWSNSYLIYYHSKFVQRRWRSFYPAAAAAAAAFIWTKQGPKYPLWCTGVAPRGARCVLVRACQCLRVFARASAVNKVRCDSYLCCVLKGKSPASLGPLGNLAVLNLETEWRLFLSFPFVSLSVFFRDSFVSLLPPPPTTTFPTPPPPSPHHHHNLCFRSPPLSESRLSQSTCNSCFLP